MTPDHTAQVRGPSADEPCICDGTEEGKCARHCIEDGECIITFFAVEEEEAPK